MELLLCDIVGCDEAAEYEDDMQSKYCISCMEQAIDEGMEIEEFKSIN